MGVEGAKEAPGLRAQVDRGDLPPLAERLPAEPKTLEPLDRIGRYGGTVRRAETDISGGSQLLRMGVGTLLEWDLETVEPVESVTAGYEISADGGTYTFALREGIRWSDGEAFTADDLVFYYDAVLMNEELTPVPPGWLSTDGVPAKIVGVDEFTVEFRFEVPNGLLPRFLAYPAQSSGIVRPAHYLERFHPDYASPDELDRLVSEEGVDSWVDLFATKSNPWLNPELPVLNAWQVTTPAGAGTGNRAVIERNPYFWKVDSEGNQLPYIDRIVFELVDAEAQVLQASNGEDLQVLIGVENLPVLLGNQDEGGYTVHRWISGAANQAALYTNQCHAEPVLRELMARGRLPRRAVAQHRPRRVEPDPVQRAR